MTMEPMTTPPGERMDYRTASITTIQEHLVRYVWALKHCAGKRVLDAGCGIGAGAALIQPVAVSLWGVDANAEAVSEAAKRAPQGIFRQSRIEDLSAQDPFQTVVCLEVLEHLDDMEVGLAKLLELTAPGGKLLLSMPVHQGENHFHHGRDYSVADWDAFMGGRGLQLTRFYQPRGGDVDAMSNVEIRYRTTSTVAAQGYTLYVVSKGGESAT